jgi:hypothetical protein
VLCYSVDSIGYLDRVSRSIGLLITLETNVDCQQESVKGDNEADDLLHVSALSYQLYSRPVQVHVL